MEDDEKARLAFVRRAWNENANFRDFVGWAIAVVGGEGIADVFGFPVLVDHADKLFVALLVFDFDPFGRLENLF